MIRDDVWLEQAAFNSLLRTPGEITASEGNIAEFLRDMGLNMMSEIDELLRTTTWKHHRRVRNHRPNREHRLEELVDLFKIWLTMVQTLGYSQREIVEAFWRKSMVVRQRHSEEFVQKLDRPTAVIDIDGVLCDYTVGFCTWLANRAPLFAKAAMQIANERRWFGKAEDFGMSESEWQGFKHEFRAGGHKRFLPVMPGAKAFLDRCREEELQVVLLTSRAIDRYPNVYTDTVYWLNENKLHYDHLWWSLDKGERLIQENALRHVRFVIDDDPRYVQQFLKVGLTVYWMQSVNYPDIEIKWVSLERVRPIKSLGDILSL